MGNKTEENEVARDGVPESSMNPASVSSERNSSDETDETIIKLQPVICNGSVLKLPVGQDDSQTYSVVSKIIKHIYATRLPSIQCVLPEGYDKWDDSDPVNAKKLINAYNPAAKKHFKLWNGAVNKDLDDWALPYCTETVAAQICNLAIECTIPDPKILNSHYKSFSPEVYGETNLEQMALIIKQLNLDQNDVFVDMGSGIGQLVAFTAAFSKVKKAIGIEIADRPSMYASKLQDTFEKLMSHFGKQHASFKLYKGSFLDQKFIDMILKEATVLFINNVAFGPELNTEIKAKIISELNNGVRIVSTREFASMKREINERQLNDVTALLDVKVLESCHQPCSWTSKKVPFYLHTVDGTKIVEFFNQKMNGKRMSATPSREGSQSKDCKEPKSRKKESSESRRSSTSTPPVVKNETRFDDDDENWCGRTTRLMWKAQTEKCAQKQKTPAPSSPKRPADDNDYAPLKKSRKTTEKKRKNSASVKATTSSAAAAATAATSTASIAAAAATTPTTTTAKTVTTTVTSPQQSQKQQPAAPEQLKQASKMLSSPTAPEAAVKVEQKPDSSVMEYIHQLHDKTVISTQQMHSAKEEIARGELVRIMLPLQNEQMDAATQQQQQNHQPPLPPPPPSQQPIVQHIVPPQVIPANNNHMDLATDQRHTFMIPPTDPLYNSIVSFYLSLKSLINKAQSGDAEFVQALRQEIEVEKIRNRELKDIVNNVSNSVKAELARGVGFMHERLVDLDMGNVQEVSELLIGSKNIVSRHKELTQRVAHEQATVAQYEQMIRDKNGNIGERLLEQDFSFEMMDELQNQNKTNPDEQTDQNLLSPTVNSSTSATNYANISNSSSGSQSRRNRPRQRAGANAKRIGSGAEKVEEPSEEVELSIQRFVKEALKVDNAVKEKERRARGSGGAGHSDKISSRKGL